LSHEDLSLQTLELFSAVFDGAGKRVEKYVGYGTVSAVLKI
jgi:hypothetical protein